jgi:hypothetical protein
MKLVIDTDALVECAVYHMENNRDLKWPVGANMQDLYKKAMRDLYKETVKENNAKLNQEKAND